MIYFKKPDSGEYLVAINPAHISAITQETRSCDHDHPRTRLHFGGPFIDVLADMDQVCRAIETDQNPLHDWISTRNETAEHFLLRINEGVSDIRDSQDLRILAGTLKKYRHPLHVYHPAEA